MTVYLVTKGSAGGSINTLTEHFNGKVDICNNFFHISWNFTKNNEVPVLRKLWILTIKESEKSLFVKTCQVKKSTIQCNNLHFEG